MYRFLLVSLIAVAQTAPGQSIDVGQLPGTWHGEGRFYEVKLLRENQAPAFDLTIALDLTLSGTVGEARIVATRPTTVGKRIDYHVMLDRPVGRGEFLKDKDHLVILITAADAASLSADFHMKSRFGFDFSMHPGSLEAVRKGND
jgi:hypothetical protein